MNPIAPRPSAHLNLMPGTVSAGPYPDPELVAATPAEQPVEVAPLPLAEVAGAAGLRHIHVLAWRDLDDPEAGGSEVHASNIARVWAAAGIDVTLHSSSAAGYPAATMRDGYRVIRRSGRYMVFPRTALSSLRLRTRRGDGLVEIWNGMPFFSPLWARCPSIVLLHHVHAEMWRMVLKPAALARAGEVIEFGIAPAVYRRSQLLTLSWSSKAEIVDLLGIPAERIAVVPPGVDTRFQPGAGRADHPVVVGVGRLVPVKRFHLLIDALVRLRERHPTLEAVIVGEGSERPKLEAQIQAAGAGGWISLPGRLADDELVALYRRAWVLAGTSLREGWGMTITEAAACGTPAVVTDIAGHHDAVNVGRSGLLVPSSCGEPLVDGLDRVLSDRVLRRRLSAGAHDHAGTLRWDVAARRTLDALVAEAGARRGRRA